MKHFTGSLASVEVRIVITLIMTMMLISTQSSASFVLNGFTRRCSLFLSSRHSSFERLHHSIIPSRSFSHRTTSIWHSNSHSNETKTVDSSLNGSNKAGSDAKRATSPTQKQNAPPKKAEKPPRGKNLLIVGLGNPGKEYSMTRHNAGYLVLDELAKRLGADLKLRSTFQGEYGSANFNGKSIGFLKPITFMNKSGQSVRKVLDYFKLPVSAVLIVVDEVALDLGQIRLRETGSAGGHNGLKSIEGQLKSKDYNRLRVGVGGAAPGKMVDHVLGEFSRSEKKQLEEVLLDSCEAIEQWILDDDTPKVMSKVNAPR